MTATALKQSPGVKPGEVLAGKYRVERVLGAGGMGVVVAAHHLQLDERVAHQVPPARRRLRSAEAVARFAREARAAVKIKSEHVARVIDVGRLENGAPYMVMEYLEGGDLAAWLRSAARCPSRRPSSSCSRRARRSPRRTPLGIVHRDLKPANLFLRRAGPTGTCR